MTDPSMQFTAAMLLSLAATASCMNAQAANDELKIVIIRHAEKPEVGDNLSCQGQNRARQLPPVLIKVLGQPPAHTYVPMMKTGASSTHVRMFQTVTPFAVKYDLTVDSRFDEGDVDGAAQAMRSRSGTALVVWEHSQIPALAKALGVSQPPSWHGKDFDAVWTIRYKDGQASLTRGSQNLRPSAQCQF